MSQRFCDIFVRASFQCVYHGNEFNPCWVPVMVGSMVDALTSFALLNIVCDIISSQINVQSSRIRKLLLYEFDLSQNPAEATKNICYSKGEGAVDQSYQVIGKFRLNCNNLDDQASLGRPKTMDTEAVL